MAVTPPAPPGDVMVIVIRVPDTPKVNVHVRPDGIVIV